MSGEVRRFTFEQEDDDQAVVTFLSHAWELLRHGTSVILKVDMDKRRITIDTFRYGNGSIQKEGKQP